eukprot:6272603-Amphidinium_carterae.1
MKINGGRGSGSNGSGKEAGSTQNKVIGTPNPLSGRSNLDPLQGGVGNRTGSGGRGEDDDGNDDDDNNDGVRSTYGDVFSSNHFVF